MKLMALMAAMMVASPLALGAQQKPSVDEMAIAKVRSAYQQAIAAQTPAAVAKLFTPDGEEMPPDTPAVKGRAAIEAYHKQFGQQFMVHGITITPTETHVTGDSAVEIGTTTEILMVNKTGAMLSTKGKYIVLLKKDKAGAWLVTHVIYNNDAPAQPPSTAVKK